MRGAEITKRYRATGKILPDRLPPLPCPDQYKWRPMIGMRVLLARRQHRVPERGGAVRGLPEATVEASHQGRGAAVVDVPERHQDGLRAGVEPASHQSEQLVAADQGVQPCAAPAQGHEI